MLHDDRRVAVLDERRADDLEVLVLEDHLVVVLFLAQVEGGRGERCIVPGGPRRLVVQHVRVIDTQADMIIKNSRYELGNSNIRQL